LGEEDLFSIQSREEIFEEKLSELEVLKTDMIDAEEEDYQDDSLGSALATFFMSALVLWFAAGPLAIGLLETDDLTYGFLTWLKDLGDLHWAIFLFFLAVNWGIWLVAVMFHWTTLISFIAIFRRKLTAEEQKDKAISSIVSKIEDLKSEAKSKNYIKKFLKARSTTRLS